MNVNFQLKQDAQLLWPTLRLEEFFDGAVTGWGVTQGRFGGLKNQFRIAAKGNWKARRSLLQLTETYSFDDGHIDTLTWKIEKGDGGYRGKETRIPGFAEGKHDGNGLRWQYRRRVPQKGGGERLLSFDDRFWLQERDVLVSRASVTKFGVEIATISAFFVRGR